VVSFFLETMALVAFGRKIGTDGVTEFTRKKVQPFSRMWFFLLMIFAVCPLVLDQGKQLAVELHPFNAPMLGCSSGARVSLGL
jgi:hypothetical protein